MSASKKKSKPAHKEEDIPDSWDAASVSSSDEAEPNNFKNPVSAPPLTTATTTTTSTGSAPLPTAEKTERPAKTDAVARRMISAALGVRARSTKEQREFDSALRERERKRKEEERESRREQERREEEAKRSVWED